MHAQTCSYVFVNVRERESSTEQQSRAGIACGNSEVCGADCLVPAVIRIPLFRLLSRLLVRFFFFFFCTIPHLPSSFFPLSSSRFSRCSSSLFDVHARCLSISLYRFSLVAVPFFFLSYIYFLLLWSLVSSEVKLKQPNLRFYVILSVGVELRQSSHSPRAPRAMYSSTSNFYRDVNLCARVAFALSCIRGWKENFFDIISEEFYLCPVERLESNVCRRSSPYFLYSC